MLQEDNAVTESGSEQSWLFRSTVRSFVSSILVLAEYLLDSVGDFDGCLNLSEPEYTDEELLQCDERTIRLQNEFG